MSRMAKKTSLPRNQRRDIVVMTIGGLVGLLALWLSGALDTYPALLTGAIGGVFTLIYYLARAASLRGRRPVEPTYSKRDLDLARVRARRAVLDGLVQPALVLRNGQIEACNVSARRLFNLPADALGMSLASLRDPALLASVETVLSEGGQASCELQPARRPGEFWLAELTEIDGDAREHGLLIIMTDQKPVRSAERARADFLANASHELRTPLTSISGFVETMQGPAKEDYEAWPRFVEIMGEQTRHMKDLITDLLSLSRIELSEHLLPDEQLDLTGAVDETIEALQHLAAQRGLNLRVERPVEALSVRADEGELKQVIRNLVSNAMKYAPDESDIIIQLGQSSSLAEAQTMVARGWQGAGRATLLTPDPTPGPSAWLRVRDLGPGIEPNYLPRLGERFFRVDNSRGGPVDGTGLGLAIVKHIMARHRGGLAVESKPGEGAAFSVWFPKSEA